MACAGCAGGAGGAACAGEGVSLRCGSRQVCGRGSRDGPLAHSPGSLGGGVSYYEGAEFQIKKKKNSMQL